MTIAPQLRNLNIDLPACPSTLVKLSLLMAEENCSIDQLSALIENDMALSSAVVRTVNSALFGLLKLNPDLFWPAIAVATLGNTLGGLSSYLLGRLIPPA